MGVANYFVGQSIGVDEKNTFQLKFIYSSNKTVGATVLGGLWALAQESTCQIPTF